MNIKTKINLGLFILIFFTIVAIVIAFLTNYLLLIFIPFIIVADIIFRTKKLSKFTSRKLVISIILSLFLFFVNFIIYLLIYRLLEQEFKTPFLSFIFCVSIPDFILYNFLSYYTTNLINAAYNEYKHPQLVANSDKAICNIHVTRVLNEKYLFFKTVNCRKDKSCSSDGKLDYPVENIVGVIGDMVKENLSKNNFYINIWNQEYKKFHNGDFDVIEIRETSEIKDIDSVIQRLYRFLFNDTSRTKPLEEVKIKIVGNPEIDDNSIRFLKDKFFEVEFVKI